MPRRVSKISPKDFEPRRKNKVSLGSDSNIDNDFKSLRIGDIPTGFELSLDKIKTTKTLISDYQKIDELLVTRIKGSAPAQVEVPSVLFQGTNAESNSAGLGVNVFNTGSVFLECKGSNSNFWNMCDSSHFYLCGSTSGDGDGFYWRSGTFTSYDSIMTLLEDGDLSVEGTITSSNGVCGGASVTNHITNDADDTMAGTLTMDKNSTATTTSTTDGLKIDFDHTGISASLEIVTNRGLSIDVASGTPTHVGYVINYGIYQRLTAGTSGTQTNYGIYNIISGADTNYGIYNKVDNGSEDIRMVSSADEGDYCSIATTTHGATTIATVDDNATAANLTLDIDGTIELNADGGQVTIKDDTASHFLFDCDNTRFTIYDDTNANDYFQIGVDAEGATTIVTVDADTTVGHLTLRPDGDLILDPASQKVIINATDGLYFDGGGDTYIQEHAVTDRLLFTVGGDSIFQLYERGADGNEVTFNVSSVGWNRQEATFSATGVIASGGTDDTDIDFRFSNKYRLEMTGDITTMNLIFPSISGNFLLVCTTNGDHDVTNWKVWEQDESAATTTDVMWAGGSVPAFTSSGIDIVSFYWDANEQQAYGVASLAFATP